MWIGVKWCESEWNWLWNEWKTAVSFWWFMTKTSKFIVFTMTNRRNFQNLSTFFIKKRSKRLCIVLECFFVDSERVENIESGKFYTTKFTSRMEKLRRQWIQIEKTVIESVEESHFICILPETAYPYFVFIDGRTVYFVRGRGFE